jgi:hypothetical protein
MFPQDFFLEVKHKKVHIHENFWNYVVLETMTVKFMHHSSNWNLGDFSNQGYTFVSMGYD